MKKIVIALFFLMLRGPLEAQDGELVQRASFPNEDSKIENDYLIHPFDLKIHGRLYYVCDAEECCIKVFSANGEYIKKIGRKGQGPGEMGTTFKFDIAGEAALIYCADSGNSRVDIFDFSGSYRGVIKTLIPPRDVVCLDGKIITASYNRTLNSLYTLYDADHRIAMTFGDLFDQNVPDTRDALSFYTMVNHSKEGGLLYAFYEYLPFVSIYAMDGKLVNRVVIDNNDVKRMYEKNIRALKEGPIDGVLGVAPWNRGGCIDKKQIYYLGDFSRDEVWAFDLSGKLLQKISFRDKKRRSFLKLVAVDDGRFVFLDWNSGQVKVYEIERKG